MEHQKNNGYQAGNEQQNWQDAEEKDILDGEEDVAATGAEEAVGDGSEEAAAAEDAGKAEEPAPEPTIEDLMAELKATQAALVEVRMRAQAETENFKKRLEREHGEHLKFAAEKVMKDLIPTLDNLELAITYGSKAEACKDMLMGIEMTQKLLLEAVGHHGLSVVGCVGEPFDPALHEAVGMESREDIDNGAISRVMQSGYILEGRLLRPAKVMMNQK